MDWKKKKVLITGAGGFIGSHLTEKMVSLGANVRAFVRYNSRNDWGLLEMSPEGVKKDIDVIMGDLGDTSAINEAIKGVDIVFHLGAIISIPYSYLHPRETIETNVMGTLNVLKAGMEHSVQRIVHTSTSEVYGTAQYLPIDEKHPLQGQSPYSASKIGADKIAESFFRSYDLPVVTVRPFNTYGPRQSARAIIPTIITQMLTSDIVRVGSTHPKRDFTYIDDTIDGFIKTVEREGILGEAINIGSNIEISIGDLIEKIKSITGKEVEVKTEEVRVRPKKSEVLRLCADNSKARELLGWEPKTSLDEGLKSTIAWISENIELYKSEMYTI